MSKMFISFILVYWKHASRYFKYKYFDINKEIDEVFRFWIFYQLSKRFQMKKIILED